MKPYTREERSIAKAKLPRPVSDFLDSETITDIYMGLIRKNRLNLRQGSLMSNLANLTLLGLEPESALETNLHQVLPELSAETMRELTVDLNDRVFKEARRRLQENIIEPEPEWDEEEFGPKPEEGSVTILPTDEELERLEEKEKAEGWKPPEEEYVPPIAATNATTQGNTTSKTPTKPVDTFQLKELPALPIAQQKLQSSSQNKTELVAIKPYTSGIQQVSKEKPNDYNDVSEKKVETINTKEQNPSTTLATSINSPKTYKNRDPYREVPE